MVLIFSKVQRCNINGAPNGFYGFKEEFDAHAELAKQLVDANVAEYVEKQPAPAVSTQMRTSEPALAPEPEPEPVHEPETPVPETPQKFGKNRRR